MRPDFKREAVDPRRSHSRRRTPNRSVQAAAYYLQHVSLPVLFWRACGCPLRFVFISRGGSRSCGGGCVSAAGSVSPYQSAR
jgi:hypothetical protein